MPNIEDGPRSPDSIFLRHRDDALPPLWPVHGSGRVLFGVWEASGLLALGLENVKLTFG